ncbi:MAG: peptidylprolyl isomerase [bacterium]
MIEILNEQKNDLKKQISVLKDDAEKYKQAHDKLKFLGKKLGGIKAAIKTNHGDIELKFFGETSPIHCFNFITRAECGFYDNTRFHRIIPGFMIQGGDPNSRDNDPYNDGQGGPIAAIPHEFNKISHKRGILSMARTGDKNAGAGSQFYIMHADNTHLDNEYTVFGQVTSGMDVVDKIAAIQTNKTDPRLRDHLVKPVIIKTIKVYR